jgi:branched-chain amino acid transport system permease protein
VIGIIFLLWFDGPPLVQLSLTQVLATFVAVMGLDILMGYCGQISLAHGAFLGVGAYAGAITLAHLHMPLGFAFPIGTLAAAIVGVVVGVPAVRLSGLYFAQITLLFALVVPELIIYFSSVTGGSNGLTVREFISLSPFELFLVYGVIAGGCALLVRLMVRSSLGRRWRAVRDNVAAAAGLGQRTSLTKLGAFAVGCGLGGLGGVMQAVTVGSLSPDSYPVWESIYLQAAQVIGGMTSMVGNLLGAFFVEVVAVYTGGSQVPPDFIFGAAFVVVLLVTPQGIGPLIAQGWDLVLGVPSLVQHGLASRRDAEIGGGVVAGSAVAAGAVAAGARAEGAVGFAPIASGSEPAPAASATVRVEPVKATNGSNGKAPHATPALEVSNLSAGYSGSEVVRAVDLEVGAGEVVGLVGPNGAGKSTGPAAHEGEPSCGYGHRGWRLRCCDWSAGPPTRRGLDALPDPGSAHAPARRDPLRRTTADAGPGPGPAHGPEAPAPRRAAARVGPIYPGLGLGRPAPDQ